jgi:hypothetical protein
MISGESLIENHPVREDAMLLQALQIRLRSDMPRVSLGRIWDLRTYASKDLMHQ